VPGQDFISLPAFAAFRGADHFYNVAFLAAAFLAAEFSFDGHVRHAGYIATWISLLRNDKRAFFTAASKAQAAADYLRGLALAEPIAKAA
jgi:antirestriction protein ArdC